MKSLTRTLFGFAAALAFTASAQAVPFTITNLTFNPGTGYGVGTGTTTTDDPNFLDVVFAASSAPAIFNLSVGQSKTFTFGSLNLRDLCINEHITGNTYVCGKGDETGNLNVDAKFTFTDPYSGTSTVSATGTAVSGPVKDTQGNDTTAVDLTIDFTKIFVDFGTGGRFSIDLSDVSFTDNRTLDTTATVTLISDSVAVPEPASLALLGLGLLGVGFVRRTKAA